MIRYADIKDIPYLLEIENLSFMKGDCFTRQQFYYAIKYGKASIYIWHNVLFCLGYVYVTKNGHIYSLAVHPIYRGQNVGFNLLRHVEGLFAKKGKVTLEVRLTNPALFFYAKHGYKPVKVKYNYYSDGTDAILMQKDLGNAER